MGEPPKSAVLTSKHFAVEKSCAMLMDITDNFSNYTKVISYV